MVERLKGLVQNKAASSLAMPTDISEVLFIISTPFFDNERVYNLRKLKIDLSHNQLLY